MRFKRGGRNREDALNNATIKYVMVRPSSLPAYERYTVIFPKLYIDLDHDAAEKLARDVSRSLRRAGVAQNATIELRGDEADVARIAIDDAIKIIDWYLSEIEPNSREYLDNRETLLSIGVDKPVLSLDFDQARTLMDAIEELGTFEEEAGRPENFYYDDDRFNQLFMRVQDATSPG